MKNFSAKKKYTMCDKGVFVKVQEVAPQRLGAAELEGLHHQLCLSTALLPTHTLWTHLFTQLLLCGHL